jgi:hypothetical protein
VTGAEREVGETLLGGVSSVEVEFFLVVEKKKRIGGTKENDFFSFFLPCSLPYPIAAAAAAAAVALRALYAASTRSPSATAAGEGPEN